MFDTVDEIKTLIKEKEAEKEELDRRFEKDWDLLTLKPYVSDQGQASESYTSSAPKNHMDGVMDGVNRAQLGMQIQLADDASDKEKDSAQDGELYLLGALNAIDRRLIRMGEQPLREGLAHHICARGWYGLMARVYVPKGKTDTLFDVMPWDPLHMVWEQGSDGLLWAAYTMWRRKSHIKSEYGIDIRGTKGALVTDFFDVERNSVIIEDSFGKEPTEHKIERVPVLIGAVGSMPTVQRKWETVDGGEVAMIESSTLVHRGDSIWSSSRGLYGPQNRYTSYVLTRAKKSVAGSIVVESEDGAREIKGNPFDDYQAIPAKKGERVYALEMPALPPETAATLAIIGRDIDQSTLPRDLPDRAESGRALTIRLEVTRAFYERRTEALAQCYTWLGEELLAQFATKGIKPVELHGHRPGDNSFFQVKTKPSDIKKSWVVKATIEPRLPRDEEAEMNLYLAATSSRDGEEPAVSRAYGRENILKLNDPQAEHDKVLAEIGENSGPIKVMNTVRALRERERHDLADDYLAWAISEGIISPPNGGGAPNAPLPGNVVNGAGPGGPPAPAPVPPIPEEMFVAISNALEAAGEPQLVQQLGEALVAMLQTGQPIDPRLIEAIVAVLVQTGQQQLASAFVEALVGAGGPPPPAAPPSPVGAVPAGPPII